MRWDDSDTSFQTNRTGTPAATRDGRPPVHGQARIVHGQGPTPRSPGKQATEPPARRLLYRAADVMNHSVDMALLAGGALTAGALFFVAPFELGVATVALLVLLRVVGRLRTAAVVVTAAMLGGG
ncbi:MAG TPA: hypothetical protein VIJ22_18230, partial [Polyangiaceae bacterium]